MYKTFGQAINYQKLVLVAAIFLAACQPSISSVPANTATPFSIAQQELQRQEQKWKEADIRHYRFRLFRGCLCIENEDVLIEVENGQIVSLQYQSGKPMEPGNRTEFEGWGTMEKLFATVETELRGESLKVTATYDPSYGFPVEVFSERSSGADDELNLTISDFEVLP